VFVWLQEGGQVPVTDMFRTFNMGVGLVVVAAPENAGRVSVALGSPIIGEIVRGEPTVIYQ
jgi:phosphoribosylaminoimidazole (AIR) synthetase